MTGGPREEGAVELAMRRHGVTPSGLSGLARKAVLDYYESKGGHLSGAKLDDAIGFVRERGIAAVVEYDPVRARGVSPTTYAYRIMRLRVTDWLRMDLGDRRFGNDGRVSLSSDGEMRFVEPDEDTVELAAERIAGGLSERSSWTLRHVASRVAEGLTVFEVAQDLGRSAAELEGLLADLADELAVTMPGVIRREPAEARSSEISRLPRAEQDHDLFVEWLEVAA